MDWYDALGVKAPEEPAEEPAEEVNEEVETPEEQPEIAEPEEADEGAHEGAKQSRQENARYAAARRKAEQERDAAVAKAKQDAQAEIDQIIASMGLQNPYNDKPITNRAELTEYQNLHEQKKQQQIQQQLDMDDDEFNQMIEDLPVVKEARATAKQAREEQVRKQIEREMAEIAAINPAIKEAADLARDEKYDQILSYVNRGLSLTESYKLAHIDDLSRRTGRQQAINQAGKAHMSSTQARGDGAMSVPSEENFWYHALNPKATDGRIAEHYNKLHRK